MSISYHRPRVAFQGERGAFSEEAAIALLGTELELVPRRTFADLFHSFDENVADYIVAPVENSICGPVQASLDLLKEAQFEKIDEVSIAIAQHLIGCPGAIFSAVASVQSHPVALAQCGRFLASHPRLKAVEAHDTAGSVAEIINRADPRRAAIAGRRAAQLYGGVILREDIQDQRDNATRFLLLAPVPTLVKTTQFQTEKEYNS